MDSITQITLGAAIGEALLGKKTGYRAAAWGAVLGTVPDLDVLAGPFIDSVTELQFHRGFTHSILFCLIASPVFGWLINRIHTTKNAGWKMWSVMAFMVFATHIFIDVLTTYGTQIFFPFSNYPVTADSVYIIDPLYTLPLFFCLVTALFWNRLSNKRRILNYLGLTLSSFYLIWGLGIKPHITSVFASSFVNQLGRYDYIKTTPNGPTTFLWNGYIIQNDTLYHAVYSIFDDSKNVEFSAIQRNTELISLYLDDPALEVLLWFSKGYYTVNQTEDGLIFYDLRFGRTDFWLHDDGEYVWANQILFNEQGTASGIRQTFPAFNTRTQNFSRFWRRLWGE